MITLNICQMAIRIVWHKLKWNLVAYSILSALLHVFTKQSHNAKAYFWLFFKTKAKLKNLYIHLVKQTAENAFHLFTVHCSLVELHLSSSD